jgi:hypothetical protein
MVKSILVSVGVPTVGSIFVGASACPGQPGGEFAAACRLTGSGRLFEGVAERPHLRSGPPLFQRGVECRPAMFLDGKAAAFRDGVLPPRLAFDVATAAFLGCLLRGKSRLLLPFLLPLPPLLAAMMRALSDLLVDRNGVAVVATHSPVVLQEVPAS